ncbi:hypothetical protein LXL04_004023 [Taraxacum kok-saghyz]
MTITVDNASSNDKAFEFLSKTLSGMYQGGKNFHIRYHNIHVESVQKAVRYIRHSTGLIKNFKKCMKTCGLEGENSCVESSALVLQDVFFEHQVQGFWCFSHKYYVLFVDTAYTHDLKKVPERAIYRSRYFSKSSKQKTEIMSSSTKPLIDTFLHEILDVEKHLTTCATKIDICYMIPNMRSKYNKYWGSIEN